MTNKTAVATPITGDMAEVIPGQAILFKDMAEIMHGAELMAGAKNVVPAHLLGNPGGCMAIIMQAQRWGFDAFAVAQKTHVVNGNLGYEAQLVNAVIQSSGMISGRFHYEYKGEGASLSCRVGATIKGESAITWGEWLSFTDVTTKNSPLWKTNPRQQLGYLQVKNWGRLYCPGAILGVYSADELEDLPPAPERDITPGETRTVGDPPTGSRTSALKDKLLDDEPEDAEIVEDPPEGDIPATTYADVTEALNKASTPEELQAALAKMADFVGIDGNEQYKDELGKAYRDRLAQLKAIADEQNQ